MAAPSPAFEAETTAQPSTSRHPSRSAPPITPPPAPTLPDLDLDRSGAGFELVAAASVDGRQLASATMIGSLTADGSSWGAVFVPEESGPVLETARLSGRVVVRQDEAWQAGSSGGDDDLRGLDPWQTIDAAKEFVRLDDAGITCIEGNTALARDAAGSLLGMSLPDAATAAIDIQGSSADCRIDVIVRYRPGTTEGLMWTRSLHLVPGRDMKPPSGATVAAGFNRP
jgi:hypothetical protein